MATALPPDQLQAIVALLQQGTINADEAVVRSIPSTVLTLPFDNPTRNLLLEGTAFQAKLDQILIKTGQGDIFLKPQNLKDMALLENLPARVSVQLRPGPNGLEAALVVGTKNADPHKPAERSYSAGGALAGASQTLTAEIPKVGQVFQVTVLPSSLFSTLGYGGQKNTGGAYNTPLQNTGGTMAQTISPSNAGAEKIPAPTGALPNNSTAPVALPHEGEAVLALDAARLQNNQGAGKNESEKNIGTPPQSTTLKIVKVITPDQAEPATLQQQASGTENDGDAVVATVRGQTPSGQPLLSVGDNILAVRSNKNWPVGTKLQINLGAGAELTIIKDLSNPALSWEGLQQTLDLLAQQNPAAFKELMRMRLPQPSAQQLPGTLLFLLNAFQKNNILAWLGPDIEDKLIGFDRLSLLKKMKEEWQNNQYDAHDDTTGAWRGMNVPLFDDGRMQMFRFYIQSHSQRKKEKERSDGHDFARRFLIDMALSRLGPVQLDGLVHKKRLELVVRTDTPLPETLRSDLRAHYIHALEEVRYSGELRFQANKIGWVPLQPAGKQPLSRNV